MSRHSHRGQRLLWAALAACSFASASTASAALIAYEPFDYADGANVRGQNGGSGFTAAWQLQTGAGTPTSTNSDLITAGSLVGPAGLPTAGNRATLTGEFGTLQLQRNFPNIAGAAGDVLWISFLARRSGATNPANAANPYDRGVNVSFFNTENTGAVLAADGTGNGTPERVGAGGGTNAPDNNWSVFTQGSVANRVAGVPAVTYGGNPNATWVLLKIEYVGTNPNISNLTLPNANKDNIYMWLDASPLSEPGVGTASASITSAQSFGIDASNLDYVRPFVGNTASGRPFGILELDEIRIGTTFADAAGVPEPATAALAAFSVLAMVAVRRKK